MWGIIIALVVNPSFSLTASPKPIHHQILLFFFSKYRFTHITLPLGQSISVSLSLLSNFLNSPNSFPILYGHLHLLISLGRTQWYTASHPLLFVSHLPLIFSVQVYSVKLYSMEALSDTFQSVISKL